MPTKTQQTMADYIIDHDDEFRLIADQHEADLAGQVSAALLQMAILGASDVPTFWLTKAADKFSAAVREHASDNGVEITDGM